MMKRAKLFFVVFLVLVLLFSVNLVFAGGGKEKEKAESAPKAAEEKAP